MSDNHTFHYALGASLALHALLLLAFPELIDNARRAVSLAPQITARLMEPEPPLAPAPPARKVPPRVDKLPAPVASVAPQPAPSSSPPMLEAPGSLSRDQYRVLLIDEARRHKRYPPLARENNWQGDVVVGVSLGANGRAAVSLRASSGHEVLDRQALDMFTQAAQSVPVPQALRGAEFALELRAVYALED